MSTYEKHVNGTVSELLAEAFFVSKGHIVSKPINDFNEYDLIIDCEDGLKRVQVKTIYWDNTKMRNMVSCVTSHIRGNNQRYNKKYNDKSFDILCAVHKDTKTFYLIPFEDIKGRRSITFYPEGKPKTVNSRYVDFESYREAL
ncbi:group I intron-associated PD-(D/E)XK endonuclease [Latilactobacillus curvatus]|uniref:group I intron-associated PD-(D/E)XK endonuclease n=1 Tax=Latilactobacillus curvatus TaxID=28038 RepID=UPI002073AD6F|nr:group I intron-associated PD-(D/E)XK endonuclease [Latilactobacillus curvatus]MCM6843399.1 group I intron-associated PD-(D/E)XK endonuclease [Latilactobacillus curvatus]MCM6861749.1 group I intron-associated PD-(D/E)XK endonuclease [Latilactobacillus curvatus]MCM6869016.1 group I intron-associated PD-(D/E)XK endonuclease [Latilactobacillus curvatus]